MSLIGSSLPVKRQQPAGADRQRQRSGADRDTLLFEDLRGDGDHYAAHVVSGAFRGKTRVQQHQMVYQALRGRMGNELHALALQTGAPED